MLINTKRLRIRNIDVRDADDLYEIRNTEFILKYNCMEKVSLPQLEHNIMDFPNDSFSIVLKKKTIKSSERSLLKRIICDIKLNPFAYPTIWVKPILTRAI